MVARLLTLLAITATTALAAAQPAGAQDESRLGIASAAAEGSLTPYTFESGYAFMSLIYDSLMWRDATGVARPWLARSVSRDATGRTVSVTLRPGITWHDGEPFTANDVAFTYQFMAQRPHPRFTPELQDIAGVRAVRELQVHFTLRRRSLGFEDQPLADVPILPRHLWAGLARNRLAPPGLPVGTGPYRMTKYEPRRSYRLQANRDYFRGAPSVAGIDIPVIRRQDTILDTLRRRGVGAVPVAVPPGTIPRGLPAVRYDDEISYHGTMLEFNVLRRPFNRRAARRAVAQALNLKSIAGSATSVRGTTVPADHGMLHPRSRWARAGVLHRFDLKAAELAFAEQGVGAFRVAAPRNDPVRLEAAQRVVRALTRVGAAARLVELSPRALDRALGRRGGRATFEAAVVGIPALASYDPAYLRAMFGDPRVASLNDGGYRSAMFDDLAQRAAEASSQRERRTVVNAQLRFLARDLPAVPLLFGGGTFAYRPTAYNRWVSIRGSGILDKRSFLRGTAAAADDPGRVADTGLVDPSDDGGISLVPFIIGFAAIMLAGGAWWLRQGRR